MRKYKLISALAEEIAKEVVRNEESWRRYLNTASGLYKYLFKEHLQLIFREWRAILQRNRQCRKRLRWKPYRRKPLP